MPPALGKAWEWDEEPACTEDGSSSRVPQRQQVVMGPWLHTLGRAVLGAPALHLAVLGENSACYEQELSVAGLKGEGIL